MERKGIGPKVDLVVNRDRTDSEIQDMIDQLSADSRLNNFEQQFLEQVSDTLVSSLTKWEINKLETLHKKYND
jgi:hypothetical protein